MQGYDLILTLAGATTGGGDARETRVTMDGTDGGRRCLGRVRR
jgi:hypothetical protein